MNADNKANERGFVITLRAHLLAASLLGATSAIAIACSASSPTDATRQGERVAPTTEALTDELAAYAASCDSIMGSTATVPAFNCDTQGIDIPVTFNGAPFDPSVNAQCDAPDEFEG